ATQFAKIASARARAFRETAVLALGRPVKDLFSGDAARRAIFTGPMRGWHIRAKNVFPKSVGSSLAERTEFEQLARGHYSALAAFDFHAAEMTRLRVWQPELASQIQGLPLETLAVLAEPVPQLQTD